MSSLTISILGGVGEIGMNLYVYESSENAIIIDSGIMFGDTECGGVDYIYPDLTYLQTIKEKLRCVIFTHGHEDHIGGAIFLLRNFDLPVYTGNFTAELLRRKFSEIEQKIKINVIENEKVYQVGDIDFAFFLVEHSIPDTFGINIIGGGMSCLHISDFRLGESMPHLPVTDLLMLDSTGAESSGAHASEDDVYSELVDLFKDVEGKIIFTTFASNLKRLSSAIKAAKKHNRKIVIEGNAMQKTVAIGMQHGLIALAESDVVTAKSAKFSGDKCMYLVGGSQGEQTSTLYPIAMGERKDVKIGVGDLLVLSSRTIPSNTGSVDKIVNSAMRLGAMVADGGGTFPSIHTSGHAKAAELLKVIKHVNPSYFIPIHGEYRHLFAHAKIAAEAGVVAENIIISGSGRQIKFVDGSFSESNEIPSGRLYFDTRGGYMLSQEMFNERKQIAKDGAIVIILSIGENFKFDNDDFQVGAVNIHIETVGFSMYGSQDTMLKDYILGAFNTEVDAEILIKQIVKRFFRKFFNRRPSIKTIIRQEK